MHVRLIERERETHKIDAFWRLASSRSLMCVISHRCMCLMSLMCVISYSIWIYKTYMDHTWDKRRSIYVSHIHMFDPYTSYRSMCLIAIIRLVIHHISTSIIRLVIHHILLFYITSLWLMSILIRLRDPDRSSRSMCLLYNRCMGLMSLICFIFIWYVI